MYVHCTMKINKELKRLLLKYLANVCFSNINDVMHGASEYSNAIKARSQLNASGQNSKFLL